MFVTTTPARVQRRLRAGLGRVLRLAILISLPTRMPQGRGQWGGQWVGHAGALPVASRSRHTPRGQGFSKEVAG